MVKYSIIDSVIQQMRDPDSNVMDVYMQMSEKVKNHNNN